MERLIYKFTLMNPTQSAKTTTLDDETTEKSTKPFSKILLNYMYTFSPALKMTILLIIFVISFITRVFSVIRFESIIHEFDPWFNFRATRVLDEKGRNFFYYWFDTESWYPLGRFVGFTVFPGLMYTTVTIANVLRSLLIPIDIRHICVFCAPLFSMMTSYFAYALTFEITQRADSGLFSALFMSVIPSYISRSAAGSYDNEAISITLLLASFYFILKACNRGSILWGAIGALCYSYLVASWGGYSFVITFVPVFVLGTILTKKFNNQIYIAYSVFYVMANIWSVQTKYIEFKIWGSSEHLGSHFIFVLIQILYVYDVIKRFLTKSQIFTLLRYIATIILSGMVVGVIYMAYSGKTKFSERIMTLLDPNYAKSFMPIVASVSEHQPTNWATFFFDTHFTLLFTPVGLFYVLRKTNVPKLFIAFYLLSAIYFASIMIRLLLVVAPAMCVLSGIGVSTLIRDIMKSLIKQSDEGSGDNRKHRKKIDEADTSTFSDVIKYTFGVFAILFIGFLMCRFMFHGTVVGADIYSSPSVILANRDYNTGAKTIIDDFREAYYWIRQNTEENAKILSWWDYGYQLAGFSNRTTLVDNNTWNHTHIAQVGRIMASSEEAAYELLDELDCDYVLIVFGGKSGYSGDDINKFLWMLRIAANAFPHLKESDFTTNGYVVDQRVSPALKNSIMYKLSYYRFWEDYGQKGKGYDNVRNSFIGYTGYKLQYFEEVFTSARWLVRIFRRKEKNNREEIAYLNKNFASSPTEVSDPTDEFIYEK
jgi:dolichyl-diphosphooligosaccharide--protein glycosyltransferase